MFIDRREFTGPIYNQIEDAYQFVLKHINLGARIDGIIRKDNEAISGRSKIRNVCIAEVFNRMGIIEQWGTGLQRMIRGCKEYGVREPEFTDMGDAVRVNFYRSNIETGTEIIQDELFSTLSDTEKKVTRPIWIYFRNSGAIGID